MVDAALARAAQGSFPTRVWRYTTGGEVDREIAPHITYSANALDDFVNEVARQIDRPAAGRDRRPTPASLNTVPGKDGRHASSPASLRSRLRARDREPPRPDGVRRRCSGSKPQVTTDQLAQKYPVYLTIDRGDFQLRLWKNLKLAKTYTIAVGQAGSRDARRQLHDRRQAGQSLLARPRLGLGGRSRRDR